VEVEVLAYPGIAEAACVAERSDVEDEVKVWIVPEPGAEIDFVDLLRHLVDRMPQFMVPRFFELTDELPKTASARIQKFELRNRGNSAGTWDREAAGWSVTRHGLRRVPSAD
jgi:crotonobetaine/carnitine-CoA ligase